MISFLVRNLFEENSLRSNWLLERGITRLSLSSNCWEQHAHCLHTVTQGVWKVWRWRRYLPPKKFLCPKRKIRNMFAARNIRPGRSNPLYRHQLCYASVTAGQTRSRALKLPLMISKKAILSVLASLKWSTQTASCIGFSLKTGIITWGEWLNRSCPSST